MRRWLTWRESTCPVHPETAAALLRRWAELPARSRSCAQILGRLARVSRREAVRRGALHLLAVADEALEGRVESGVVPGPTGQPRAAIIDMEPPHRWARIFDPAARLACLMGGADIHARPWTVLESTATDVQSWSRRAGHVQVRVGTL